MSWHCTSQKADPGASSRATWLLALVAVCLVFAEAGLVRAQFDSTGWRRFREIQVAGPVSDGVLGVPLDSALLERCSKDLADIRIVSSESSVVPVVIAGFASTDDATVLPVRTFKVTRKPGKWTDIWIDKTGKTLTRGIQVQTSSRDFIRKVEIRGADAPTEAYVVRLDGLIFDLVSPVPMQCLSVHHPENNFRYLHVRIMDDDRPPLKVDGLACQMNAADAAQKTPLQVRIVENRQGQAGGATVIVGDFGERRFPLNNLTVHTAERQFAKRATLYTGTSPASQSWDKIWEGAIFRVRRDECFAENVTIRTKPQTSRYIKVEFSGGDASAFSVDGLEAWGIMPLAVFPYNPSTSYRLYYDNPRAQSQQTPPAPVEFNPARLMAASSAVVLGPDQKNVEPAKPKVSAKPKESEPSRVRTVLGIGMLLAGLVFLFSLMLRSLSRNRREQSRATRIVNRRI